MEQNTQQKKDKQAFKKGFAEKLFNLIKHCDVVPKDGKNDFHNYKYATEATIKRKFREGLINNRLLFSATQEEVKTVTGQNDKGKETRITTIKMKFEILDVDSEAGREFICYGTGEDRGDKGLYKAITGAIKYFVFSFTLMPSGDDPEKDNPAETWEAEKKGMEKRIVDERKAQAAWMEKTIDSKRGGPIRARYSNPR